MESRSSAIVGSDADTMVIDDENTTMPAMTVSNNLRGYPSSATTDESDADDEGRPRSSTLMEMTIRPAAGPLAQWSDVTSVDHERATCARHATGPSRTSEAGEHAKREDVRNQDPYDDVQPT